MRERQPLVETRIHYCHHQRRAFPTWCPNPLRHQLHPNRAAWRRIFARAAKPPRCCPGTGTTMDYEIHRHHQSLHRLGKSQSTPRSATGCGRELSPRNGFR
jgi:hypothetical protein